MSIEYDEGYTAGFKAASEGAAMSLPTTYCPHLGAFVRTFNIRFQHGGMNYETPIKALTWREAEDMLKAIKETGEIHSETIETF